MALHYPIWATPMWITTQATHTAMLANMNCLQPNMKPWTLFTDLGGAVTVTYYGGGGCSLSDNFGWINCNVTNGGSTVDDVSFRQSANLFGEGIRMQKDNTYLVLAYVKPSSAAKQVRLDVYSPDFGLHTSGLLTGWTPATWSIAAFYCTPSTSTRNAEVRFCIGGNTGQIGLTLFWLRPEVNNYTKLGIDDAFTRLTKFSHFNVYGKPIGTTFLNVVKCCVASGTYFKESTRTISTKSRQEVTFTFDTVRRGWRYNQVYISQETGAAGYAKGTVSFYPVEPELPDLPSAGGIPLAAVRWMSTQYGISGPDVTDNRCVSTLGEEISGTGSTQTFASSGSFTVPHDGWYIVRLLGGGGGGGAGSSSATCGGGGGGGSPLYGYVVELSEGDIYNVLLGPGGTGGSGAGSNGADGTTTSFLRHSGVGANQATLYGWGGYGGKGAGANPGTGGVGDVLSVGGSTTVCRKLFTYSLGETGEDGFGASGSGYGGDGGNSGARQGNGGSGGSPGVGGAGSNYGAGGGAGSGSVGSGLNGAGGSPGWASVAWLL